MSNTTTTSARPKLRTTRHSTAKQSRKEQTVAIVGLGYVGLPLALLCEERGFGVIGFDVDQAKLNALKSASVPDLSLHEQTRLKKAKIKFSNNQRVLKDADIVIVCVPTPVFEDHTPDLRPLKSASRSVGLQLKKGALVIIESTVNPGVCEEVVIPILERTSGLKVEEDFYFAHCPERINPGDVNFSVATIPRVVGARTKPSRDRAVNFYTSVLDAEVVTVSDLKEAESVKMVENAFRDINIAFVNELAMSFDKLGIDLGHVIDAASTKPFGFMAHYPGCGVGGHCIPVDPYYLIDYAKKNGFSHKFIKSAREINNNMPDYTVRRLRQALELAGRSLSGERVALLGLAYKKDVADSRESPAFVIAEKLIEAGAHIVRYDPFISKENDYLTLQDTLSAVDSVVIATDHSLFKTLTPEILEQYEIDVVIDGRNCLDKDQFTTSSIVYRGIGR
ncbi:hypothetical protein A2837_00170 [Candidatus Kaiserbacteria bacterium RIFCSPHIGHO2_01_FULL_46_22]|uniref:UDP-glucose/GDP-mannose dehydrogenase C-terminal domain-containing protein n=1 Tax=Candidatus Kaiserbacteria bacterium RIFCSPHIGHO2_01_FULL_46_22 TaxID=1798475 RepID=A0A1F6BXB2_9BACT|nr:MAG: hypothetical protein A2837_00170 [Candidatus Kaiserbacteria bacterium RIFCSPHIGHO2_01_FULL_46_22]